MKNALVEFVGSLFLVLVVGLTVVPPNVGPFAPLAIGAALAALVYAGGHISGGHYNPAVTLAAWLRGRNATKEIAPFMLAQLLGGVAAGYLVLFFRSGNTAPVAAHDAVKALTAEFLFTFLLAYVVLNTTISSRSAGNASYGLAIGLAFCAGLYAATPLSGGALNPAIAVAMCVMGLEAWSGLWIPFVGSFAGAALAATVYTMVNPGEVQK
jgi:aquaporin Z